MEKQFKVVSIHFTTECNYNCPFCYKAKTHKMMNNKLFLNLPECLKQVTNQVALGGGEPFLFPSLIDRFARRCKKHDLICNVTTNGSKILGLRKNKLKSFTMISVSFDKHKVNCEEDLKRYIATVKQIRDAGIQVGCNLLIDGSMFKGLRFISIVDFMMQYVDRVFALFPKKSYFVDIRPFKHYYQFLSMKYKHFYVDDLTFEILRQGYDKWKKPCHYGKDLVSIDEEGFVTGCSFDSQSQAVSQIREPEDILKLKEYVFEERFRCPYLVGGDKSVADELFRISACTE